MKTAEAMEKMRRIEGRVATDQVLNKLMIKGVSKHEIMFAKCMLLMMAIY